MGMKEEFLSKKFSFPGSFLEQKRQYGLLPTMHNSRKKGVLGQRKSYNL